MRLVMLLGISCSLAAVSGCGGGNDGGGGGDDDGSGSSAGSGAPDAAGPTNQFTLTTTESRLRKRFGFAKPADGHVFVDVALVLKNTGEARPLPASPIRFSVQTADALVYSANGNASQLPKACPGNVSVATGGQLACNVGFEILAQETASTLLYADPAESAERAASAPIAAVKPALAVCSYWQSPTPSSCANCVSAAANGVCNLSFFTATADCQFACLSQDTCPQIVPSCTPSATCTTDLDTYQTCIYEQCLSSCPLTE